MTDLDQQPTQAQTDAEHRREQAAEQEAPNAPAALLGMQHQAGNGATSRAVRYGLASGGRPLPVDARRRAETLLSQSLGDVRVYDDAAAALSAQLLAAGAYTVGRHVVLGPGVDLSSPDGQKLLTHELVHTVQQGGHHTFPDDLGRGEPENGLEHEAERFAQGEATGRPSLRTAAPTVQRVGPFEWLARVFGGGSFDQEELNRYLNYLRAERHIEDNYDSDNKAREIVDDWAGGGDSFDLNDHFLRALLIEEMISGFTGNADERAILALLERSDNSALFHILHQRGTSPREIDEEFHGAEETLLRDFFNRRLTGGWPVARQGRIDPIGEPEPRGNAAATPPETRLNDDLEGLPGQCSIMHPENCATYSDWLAHFDALPRFQARTGHDVIGAANAVAPPATAADINAPQSARRPPLLHSNTPYRETDRFIDGPTEEWVRQNLPVTLVETAYQLPSDCADIAVILRHVWLAAHHRTEQYRTWTVGSALGQSESNRIQQIIGAVTTRNLARMVAPYRDEHGAIIRDLPTLSRLLHPGDILVWDHLNTSTGHSHTIIDIDRNQAGAITAITALQGNLPIGRTHAEALRDALPVAERRRAPSVSALRFAPGRRIEHRVMRDYFLQTRHGVWAWDDADDADTVLIAAGPPLAAPEPAARRNRGHVRTLADWIPEIQTAANDRLAGLFEAALYEMRATLESNRPVPEAAARALGQTAGERLWALAKGAADLGEESHYRPLTLMRHTIRRLRDESHVDEARAAFDHLDDAFQSAARGGTDIDFNRAGQPQGTRVVKILITGFDPFTGGQTPNAPPRGAWNPAGAAVLALDGATIPAGTNRVAAVEGIVLPVSYDQFRAGFPESLIRPHLATVDAVITISLNPGLAAGDPLDIERYAVGVHRLNNGVTENIPADPAGGDGGPAIIKTNAPIDEIADATQAQAQGSQAAIRRPVVDNKIVLSFISVAAADAALTALNLPAQNSRQVEISDEAAIDQIIQTMARPTSADIPGITFTAGGRTFAAQIERGPGGKFLSNEISFRAQRLLRQNNSDALSFHVHTAGHNQIPQAQTTNAERAARQQALTEANTIRTTLIASLRRLLAAVAERV